MLQTDLSASLQPNSHDGRHQLLSVTETLRKTPRQHGTVPWDWKIGAGQPDLSSCRAARLCPPSSSWLRPWRMMAARIMLS